MPSVSFTAYLSTAYTNKDYSLGSSIVASFSSGSIPSGSQITSVSLYISSMRVYTSKGLYLTLGSLGSTSTMSYNESIHSNNLSFASTGSLAGFSGGSVTIYINTAQSTSGSMVNFRDGCYMTLTVNYAQSTNVSTATVSPSSVQVGSAVSLTIYASSGTYHTATWA